MRTFNTWDERLIAEHELIERAMEVLKERIADLDAVARDPGSLQRVLEFLLVFGDRMHNRKEEDHLFPRMAQRGIPTQGGPIAVMLMEHEAERDLLQRMMERLPQMAQMSAADRASYTNETLQYLQIRAEHIWKENDILYNMGRQVLTAEDGAELLAAFDAIDTEAYGAEYWQRYEQMLREAEEGYETTRSLTHKLNLEQLDGILETLPFEITFIDAADTVSYFNKLNEEKLFPRTRSALGRKVQKCHPEKSVDRVMNIVNGFREGTLDKATFWLDFKGDKVLVQYFPVHNGEGAYLGTMEVTYAVGWIQALEGERRLLDM